MKDLSNVKGFNHICLSVNMINGINVLTQGMLPTDNTIYTVKDDFDLNGSTITIPANSVLRFDGGSFDNRTIILDNTSIEGHLHFFKESLALQGTTPSDIKLSYFPTQSKERNAALDFKNALNLVSKGINKFIIDVDCWVRTPTAIKSNTEIVINKNVTVSTSIAIPIFCLIDIEKSTYRYGGVSNVWIHGGGTFDMNSRTLQTATHSAINMYHATNVLIENLIFKDPANYHLIEIGGCKNIKIKNCQFYGFRVIKKGEISEANAKGEAIQIEYATSGNGGIPSPYFDNTECQDIYIEDNIFDGLFHYDDQGNKVYESYMYRPIGCHNHMLNNVFEHHKRIYITKNTFTSIRKVCISPRYIDDCVIRDNIATDLIGSFVSTLPLAKSIYNTPYDCNNCIIENNTIQFNNTVTSLTQIPSIANMHRNSWGCFDFMGGEDISIRNNEVYDAPGTICFLNCTSNVIIDGNRFARWNIIDKNNKKLENNRPAISIGDSPIVADDYRVKSLSENISITNNLFLDDFEDFKTAIFAKSEKSLESTLNISGNLVTVKNPLWQFLFPPKTNKLDISKTTRPTYYGEGFAGVEYFENGKWITWTGTKWVDAVGASL